MQKLIWKRIDPKRSMCPKVPQCHQQEWSENEECVKATRINNLNPKNRKDFEEIPQVYQNYISNSPFPLLSPKIRFQKSPKTLSIIGKRMDDDREKEGLQLNRSYPNIITHQFLRITSKGLILARLAHSRSNKQGMESVLTECKDSWMERR